MKRLLFAAILTILSFGAKAQLSADIAALRAYNNTNITLPTCFHCVTHVQQGYIYDSTLGLLARAVGMISSSIGLPGVLAANNTANNTIILTDSISSYSYAGYLGFQGGIFGGTSTFFLGNSAGTPRLQLMNAAHTHNNVLLSGASTGSWQNLLPDEGFGGLAGTLVTHTTKDDITITGAGYTALLAPNTISLTDPTGNVMELSYFAGAQALAFIPVLSGLPAIIQCPATSAVRHINFQDEGGYLALLDDTVGGSGLGRLATISNSVNISNTALRWNGDYTQHVNKHTILLDSVNTFQINDTNEVARFKINTGTGNGYTEILSANGLSYAKAGFTQLLLNSGTSSIGVNCATGVNNMAFNVAGTQIFNADSITKLITLGNAVPVTINYANGGMSIAAGITNYGGIATAGNGIFAIRDNHNLTGQTGAVASLSTYTTPAVVGTFQVSGYINISAVTTDVLNLQVAWKDENSVSQTQLFYPMGGTLPALGNVAYYAFSPISLRVKSGTSITVSTILATGGGTVTYDAGATITQIQ